MNPIEVIAEESAPALLPSEGRLTRSALAGLGKEKLEAFFRHYHGVLRGDDVEAVHDFRVGTRRFQQAIDFLFADPRPRRVRRLRRVIRRARRLVSLLRNDDVILGLLAQVQKRTKSAQTREALTAAADLVHRRRGQNLRRARRGLVKLRLDRFYLAATVVLDENIATQAQDHLAERAAAQLDALWTEFEEGAKRLPQDRSVDHWHQTRIAGKRVRYLLELLAACDIHEAAESVKWIRTVQTAFGDWLDEGMVRATLAGLIQDRIDLGRPLLVLIRQGDRRSEECMQRCLEILTPESIEARRREIEGLRMALKP